MWEFKRHWDFERIFTEFRDYYKDSARGEREYYDWLNALRLDESKPYGSARESFKWAANMLRYLKEDADSKYYGIIVGLPILSMNGNVYRERDLIAASLSLKGKSPSVNHKDEFWLSPRNPRNRWGTVTVEDAKYEDGAVEAILKVPKDATCPVCPRPNSKLTDLIDERHIVNVSLEGTMQGAFEFSDPPFTLLTSDVLPGIPLARIKPLEKIMVEALNFNKQEKEEKRMTTVVKAKIKEDDWQNATQPKVNVNTTTGADPNFRGNPVGPTLSDAVIGRQDDNAKTVMGGSVKDNYAMKGGYLNAGASGHSAIANPQGQVGAKSEGCSCPKGEHMEDGECVPDKREAAPAYQGDKYTANMSSPPVYAGVTSMGPGKTKPPARTIPDAGGLPTPVSASTVLGSAPVAARSVAMGNCPVESLPSLEERRARISAELKAKSSEEQAVTWEQKHNEVYNKLAETNAKYAELNRLYEQLKEDTKNERNLANQKIESIILKMEKATADYNAVAGDKLKLDQKYQELTEAYNAISKKYNDSMSTNLTLSQKVTAANEDYLNIANKLKDTEEALGRARNEAKRITKITV